MKSSKYNFICETEDGKKIAFNAMSCALAEVEDEFIDTLQNIESIDMNTCSKEKLELIEQMKQGSYIIDDCIDELKQLQIQNNRGKFSSDGLGITIAPTLLCNFKCPYCYETPNTRMMSEEVQAGIVDLVKKNVPHIKSLSVTWYGGEPLVGKDVIFKLSEQFMKICEENKVDYSTFMVTNGYLINEELIDKLFKYEVKGFQITVDGPPEIHNKRRILKSNEGTFDVIINNIKLIRSKGGHVNIRVNIDKTNVEYVGELLDVLKQNDLGDIDINFGQVTAYTEACNSIEGHCLNTEEYSGVTLDLQKLLHSKGFPAESYPYYPGIKGNYCCADQINAFVIDPEGYMYKCWNNIGKVDESVGNVLNLDKPDSGQIMRNVDWVATSPFEDECKDCKLLPVCMGGCPYLRKTTNKYSCEKWKYKFEEVLKYTYKFKVAAEENTEQEA